MFDAERNDWSKHTDRMKECKTIREDCSTARGIINDAMQRYIKKKLNARNKKQAADMELMFADLADYKSENEILDAYGYDCISKKEYNRLTALWRKREKFVDESGKFSDRVTDLVQVAMHSVGEQYYDFLAETEDAEQEAKKRQIEIEQENIRFENEQYIKDLEV